MGSSYFGEPNSMMGSEERASRRSVKKKNNYSDKKPARQPQRGLGVAQLEKIILHSQMMGLPEYDQKTNIRYGDYRSANTSRLEQANAIILENHQYSNHHHHHHSNMTMTIPFLNLYDSSSHDDDDMDDDIKKKKKHRGGGSMGTSSDTQQLLDLELRLSI